MKTSQAFSGLQKVQPQVWSPLPGHLSLDQGQHLTQGRWARDQPTTCALCGNWLENTSWAHQIPLPGIQKRRSSYLSEVVDPEFKDLVDLPSRKSLWNCMQTTTLRGWRLREVERMCGCERQAVSLRWGAKGSWAASGLVFSEFHLFLNSSVFPMFPYRAGTRIPFSFTWINLGGFLLLVTIKSFVYNKSKIYRWDGYIPGPWGKTSVQFSRSVVSNSLRPHESQHARPPCPSPTPGVHQVSDAIQPSHPLSSPSPLAPNTSQHQSLFQWVNSSHEVAKVLEFQL